MKAVAEAALAFDFAQLKESVFFIQCTFQEFPSFANVETSMLVLDDCYLSRPSYGDSAREFLSDLEYLELQESDEDPDWLTISAAGIEREHGRKL